MSNAMLQPSRHLEDEGEPAVACFSVAAFADPATMSRLLDLFAKRGMVPQRFSGSLSACSADRLDIDIQMAGLPADQVSYLARCMERLPCVERVMTYEKSEPA